MKKSIVSLTFCMSVCLIAFSSFSKDKPQKRKIKTKIVNGTDIPISIAPHYVLIAGTDNGGGSIIAKKWILTAAHLNISSATQFYAGINNKGSLSNEIGRASCRERV